VPSTPPFSPFRLASPPQANRVQAVASQSRPTDLLFGPFSEPSWLLSQSDDGPTSASRSSRCPHLSLAFLPLPSRLPLPESWRQIRTLFALLRPLPGDEAPALLSTARPSARSISWPFCAARWRREPRKPSHLNGFFLPASSDRRHRSFSLPDNPPKKPTRLPAITEREPGLWFSSLLRWSGPFAWPPVPSSITPSATNRSARLNLLRNL